MLNKLRNQNLIGIGEVGMTANGRSSSAILNEHEYLLNVASVFEDKFSIDWIVELTNKKPLEVLSALEELADMGWLKREQRGIYSASRTKKRPQNSLFTPEDRLEHIHRISSLIMAESIDDCSKAKMLCYYLLQVDNGIIGCLWLKKAGDAFLKNFKTERSLECYLKVIDDLSDVMDTEDSALLFIQTALQYGKISMARQETTKVLTILQTALKYAVKYNKLEYQALLMMNMAKNEWLRSHYDSALKYFEDGRLIAENHEDEQLLRKTNKFNTFFYYWQGRYKEVIESYERFVPELMRFPEGRFPLLGVLITSLSYVQTGQLGQGLGLMDALRSHCREIGDHHMESYAVCGMGLIMLDIQKWDEALKHFERGLEMSIRERNGWFSILCRLCMAMCYYLKGENGKSIEYLQKFIELSSEIQINSWPHPYLVELCWAMEQGKLPSIPGVSLEEEVQRLSRTKNAFFQGIAYKHQALLETKRGNNHRKIMQSLNISLHCLQASGSLIEMSKAQLELARQYLISGKKEKAKQSVLSASKILSPLNEAFIPDDLRYLIKDEKPSGEFLLKEILNLGQEIINIRESRDLVLKIISSVNRLTGAERGALFLWNGSKLEIKASKNLSAEHISHSDFAPSMKVIEDVARTGIGCIRKFEQEKNEHISPRKKGAACTVICVPMTLRGHLKGVLYHDNRLLGSAFRKSDLELLAFFSAQAAIAIDNVTSYEEMQQLNIKLTEEKNYFEEQYHFSKISVNSIIGNSPYVKKVMQQIEQVAETDSNVLILGDTGVGKELVASAIHKYSLRKEKPFICVQCSALPATLLPSELFGHEKGAFTNALKRRIGRFELADKGTIFLDEIGDLQPDMQVQLLRVLETKQFERIGGSETLNSDFRLITATNRDLQEMVEAGSFRRDLYYRLNVFPIHVPSLLKRKNDIPLLVDHFVKLYSKKLGKDFERISQEDVKMLLEYDWPGNIRELENIVERAVILNQGPVLRLAGLLPTIREHHTPSEETIVTLDDNERRHIIRTLQNTNWKVRGKGGAAELLDINPSTLFFRMKKLGISKLD